MQGLGGTAFAAFQQQPGSPSQGFNSSTPMQQQQQPSAPPMSPSAPGLGLMGLTAHGMGLAPAGSMGIGWSGSNSMGSFTAPGPGSGFGLGSMGSMGGSMGSSGMAFGQNPPLSGSPMIDPGQLQQLVQHCVQCVLPGQVNAAVQAAVCDALGPMKQQLKEDLVRKLEGLVADIMSGNQHGSTK